MQIIVKTFKFFISFEMYFKIPSQIKTFSAFDVHGLWSVYSFFMLISDKFVAREDQG
jgi:hypothetical protein